MTTMKTLPLSLLRGLALASILALVPGVRALEKAPAASPPDDTIPVRAHHKGSDRVSVFSGNHVMADEAVAGDLVAVMGDNVVDGSVRGDVVTVMGNATINGSVGGDVVATMGDITLGSEARVRGDVVDAGGKVRRMPGSVVGGDIQEKTIGIGGGHGARQLRDFLSTTRNWSFTHTIRQAGFWILLLIGLAIYMLLGLIFPGAIRRCSDTLAYRPGMAVLAAFLSIFGLPLLFLLLCITVIGIPVAILFLPLAVVAASVFGKAAVYALLGRNLAGGREGSPALAILLGGALCTLFYLLPILGFLLSGMIAILGFGCVVVVICERIWPSSPASGPDGAQRAPVAAASAAHPVVPVPAAGAAPAPTVTQEASPAPEATVPPTIPAAVPPPAAAPAVSSTLPRAGFWVRIGGLFIDALIIGVFAHVWPLAIAIYAAVMWKMKGATIGGIVFGLQVVRLDDKPVEWETAIVRTLGCFLSAIALGLGFIWIALDPEKQAWHDKIAGTVVVRVKGKSLI